MAYNKSTVTNALHQLTENSKPEWGIMTPQHMVEHLDWFYQIGLGKMEAKRTTPDKYIKKMQASLYDYKMMPKDFPHPLLKKGETEDLRYASLDEAKTALLAAMDETAAFFKANPEGTLPNPVFGDLGEYDWELYNQKHAHHHFAQFDLL